MATAEKLSMWSSFFMDLSPEGAMEELSRCGWRHAELSHEHSLVLLARGAPENAGKAFAKAAADMGMAVRQGHLDLLCDISPPEEPARRKAVEGLKPWLDLYMAIGIHAAVLHPGKWLKEGWEGRREAQLRSLAELAGHIRNSDTVICLENVPTGEELKGILSEFPEQLGVCLDTGHLNIAGEDQGEFIRHFRDRLRCLHLAENDGTADQHTMPYSRQGSVDWPAIARALKEVGYQGAYNYEVPGERACPLEARRSKLAYLKEQASWLFG